MKHEKKNKNALVLYRRRMGLSQRRVARLLGHKALGLYVQTERLFLV